MINGKMSELAIRVIFGPVIHASRQKWALSIAHFNELPDSVGKVALGVMLQHETFITIIDEIAELTLTGHLVDKTKPVSVRRLKMVKCLSVQDQNLSISIF